MIQKCYKKIDAHFRARQVGLNRVVIGRHGPLGQSPDEGFHFAANQVADDGKI